MPPARPETGSAAGANPCILQNPPNSRHSGCSKNSSRFPAPERIPGIFHIPGRWWRSWDSGCSCTGCPAGRPPFGNPGTGGCFAAGPHRSGRGRIPGGPPGAAGIGQGPFSTEDCTSRPERRSYTAAAGPSPCRYRPCPWGRDAALCLHIPGLPPGIPDLPRSPGCTGPGFPEPPASGCRLRPERSPGPPGCRGPV